MLSAALDLLDTEGVDAFTMRALAGRLQINPMTIYHHFGDRDGLISAMSERVYRSVSAPALGNPRCRIEALLRAYHAQVLKHPGLALLIFSRPTVFPEQAQRITEEIAQLLVEAGLSPQRTRLWVNILVDFTHGAAIATAIGGRSDPEGSGSNDDYNEALAELLNGLMT
ncbi:TetR/AcrR family transcriptional regulator [Consotaella salsifontis]|uniref:Transcriptional regulator, TetR family n=1 Tax=Consotaella salsifontis TaxID=1365950 RepID=A0A1T4T2R5_9HYPH|nr:TetR/AcrR family transcriptional regulator [Consotaella salsifontis]SKA34551.1 transcriptional regulator, TetR family [Consotaella salsifontis]